MSEKFRIIPTKTEYPSSGSHFKIKNGAKI